ncbi:MAG: DUF6090 family protein [Bacteroidota bacterium]
MLGSRRGMWQYLLYAIGEIFLVVIGILFALQINNWNEERKLAQLETELIQEVQNGLKNDLADVQVNLKYTEYRIKSQNALINWLESDLPYHDSLTTYFAGFYSFSTFAGNESPYETLKQLGLRNIRSDTLRNQIEHLYDIVYPAYVSMCDLYIEEINKIELLNARHFEGLYAKDMRPLNMQKIKSDKAYLHQMKSLRNANQNIILSHNKTTISEIEKTIDLINTEPQ